jgi:translation initiation factor 2B subunit (eIF-2B alpha/beta/delta family)
MSKNEKNEEQKIEYWRKDVDEIANDSIHGSTYLSKKALDIIEEYVKRELYHNRTELLQALSKLRNALVRAKPLMALIYNRTLEVVDFIQQIPKDQKNIEVIKKATLEEIEKIRKRAEQSTTSVVKLGGRLILEHNTLLTHSASSIVENILISARKQKKRFKVICTESRPLFEGTAMAKRLAKAGVKVTLIPDADIARAIEESHFVLLGTDRFTETHFVNKTGSFAIGSLAKYMNKPLYIAGETDKVLLKRNYPVRFLLQNPQEVLKEKINNLQVQNIYFEESPIEFVDKIVLEEGIFERKEFVDRYL